MTPVHRRQRETMEEGSPLQIAGGRFNKKGNLHTRLFLSTHKVSRSLYLSARIVKVYTEALTGFSHIYHPDDLNDTLLSKAVSLGQLLV